VKHLRLPFAFDRARLCRDLDRVEPEAWVAHFNANYYEGAWSGVALRAVDGLASQIYPDPTASGRYVDTPVLMQSPYFRAVLAAFECPLNSVRLLKLAARSSIHEHRDYQLSHTHGEVRIHVPIVTNDDVAFYLDDELLPMREGEAWYLDLELPHRVDNRSDHDRVHLVIDCVENEWLEGLLSAGAVAAASTATEACVSAEPGVAAPARRRRDAVLADPLAATIADFLRSIGLDVAIGAFDGEGAVPGIRIEQGTLVVDESRLRFPGDLLHEAGHLAVAEPTRRATITGDAASDGGEEMAAIAWSYAAALHLGIDPACVFHPDGYRGGSGAIIENFAQGRYFGVPLLQWFGLTYDEQQARLHGTAPYPTMRRWVRTGGPVMT
jgi:Aspartyl/Asparaginyl beta-hydroxylase